MNESHQPYTEPTYGIS